MKQVYKKGRGQTEKLLSTPLLPESKVKTVLISGKYKHIIDALNRKYGINTLEIIANSQLDKPIASHADCCFLQLDKNTFFVDKNNYNNIVNFFTSIEGENITNFNIISEAVCSPYPQDVKLNAKVIGRSVLCNTKYLSESVHNSAVNSNFKLVNTNQGYAACSSILLNNNAIITDDESIYASCKLNAIDCILISKGSVQLQGYNYGFIGGTCGIIDKNLIAFTGSLKQHTDYELINAFLYKHNIRYIELTDGPLIDIGGIIPLTQTIE